MKRETDLDPNFGTPFPLRIDRTATGRVRLIWAGECDGSRFDGRARRMADHFGLTVLEEIEGFDELMWITRLGRDRFCISRDVWFPEVDLIGWDDTPDEAVLALLDTSRRDKMF